MDNVQKIKIVSILCPVHLPPSRAYSVVYEPSYEKVVPVPTHAFTNVMTMLNNLNKTSTDKVSQN